MMRTTYLVAAGVLSIFVASKLAALAKNQAGNTRIDGWEETAGARRPDLPQSPFAAQTEPA